MKITLASSTGFLPYLATLVLFASVDGIHGLPTMERRQSPLTVKILSEMTGRYVKIDVSGTISASAHSDDPAAVFINEQDPSSQMWVFKSSQYPDQFLGVTEDEHIRAVDASGARFVVDSDHTKPGMIILKTTLLTGRTCYLAFDEDTELPVVNPCDIDLDVPEQEFQASLKMKYTSN